MGMCVNCIVRVRGRLCVRRVHGGGVLGEAEGIRDLPPRCRNGHDQRQEGQHASEHQNQPRTASVVVRQRGDAAVQDRGVVDAEPANEGVIGVARPGRAAIIALGLRVRSGAIVSGGRVDVVVMRTVV